MTAETQVVPGRVWILVAVYASVMEAQKSSREWPLIPEICETLRSLRDHGVSLKGLPDLIPVPGGIDSPAVRRAAAGYRAAGLATMDNPLAFTEDGLARLSDEFFRILKEYEEVERVAAKLGLLEA